ncbi:lipoprotein NlpI [Variibacter gotjawalensis]|uniref:Lipoprotein NlpI n=1 Tax=Variibacter gotjawalensis TaxID=1333996 RepID=A0A0S3Q1L1_9BRAD|nr:tetratricopeptide repeat protein [Variibacter gotjawalensis]NIK47735.1 tetratricopeptide (TPR) repeat protein [Variibacter gotjawalensis]RZS49624.1 lipoprotein NlpI [Variibacter gotjawalensis]BAT61888.1 lipoprotein NlpI [Variibacter gotjawalensis]
MSRSYFLLISLAAAAAVMPIVEADAQGSARMRGCWGETRITHAQRIKECTAIIEAKRESRDSRVLAYVNRAIVHYEVHRSPQRALADLDAAVRLDPDAPGPYRFRARVLHEEGKTDLAIADYDQLIRITPGSGAAEFLVERALLWKFKDDRERAIADFTEAIRLNPRLSSAFGYRGRLLVDLGAFEQAVANYTEAIAAADPNAFPSPAVEAMANRGYVHFMRADFAAAAADLSAVSDESPYSRRNEMALPFHYIAQARMGKDDATLLREQAERWQRTPLIFELFLGTKTPEQVLVDAGPENYTSKCNAHFYVGQWHLLRGNRAEARERFTAATSKICEYRDITPPAAREELKRLGQ